MNEKLSKAKTMVEFVIILNEFYKLKKTKPSKMILQILTNEIRKAVNVHDGYVIQAALLSDSLYSYLLTYAVYYDEKNDKLNANHRGQLIDKIDSLMKITSCKKI